jgi:Peptidase A4 family
MVGGHLRWTAWYELYPSPPAGFGQAAYSGDYVSMTVTYHGGGWFTLTVRDVTRHWTATVLRHARVTTMGTAEAIVEAYGPPLARFAPARFDHVSAGSRAWPYRMPGALVSPLRLGTFTVHR